ncbi:MAG TPA: hypothetical protein VK638_22315 [Edaphobacter sp.]|nr:hypothetical protein [Edaphobacter sp.]
MLLPLAAYKGRTRVLTPERATELTRRALATGDGKAACLAKLTDRLLGNDLPPEVATLLIGLAD